MSSVNEQTNPATGEVTQLPEAPTTKLYAALVKAQSVAKAVGKDAKNKYHQYRYASAEAVIEESKECFAQAGLALFQVGWSLAGERVQLDRDKSIEGRVFVSYRLIHESGEAIELSSSTPVFCEKGRPVDKAELGALTANLSYTLRGLLLLPREDESASIDNRDDRDRDDRRPREDDRREDQRPPPREEPSRERRHDQRDDRGQEPQREDRREDPTSFPPKDEPRRDDRQPKRDPEPRRIDPKVLVDDAIDGMKKLEAEFGLGGADERQRAYRELELIPPRLLEELGDREPELDRAREAYKPIVRGMRAQLGIGAATTQGAQR